MSERTDERIVATRQRWAARGFTLLSIALTIDLLVRIFLLQQEPGQYLDVAAIAVGAMLFTAIGTTASGVAPYGGKWSTSWLAIVVIAVQVVVILALKGGSHISAASITGLAGAVAGGLAAVVVLRGLYSLWERRTLLRGPREE